MAKKKKTSKTSSKSKSTKVPAKAAEVYVVKLKCPNCGEEQERVLYCDSCESALEVVGVEKKTEKEVENDVVVSKEVTSDRKVIGGDGGDSDCEEISSDEDLDVLKTVEELGSRGIFESEGDDNLVGTEGSSDSDDPNDPEEEPDLDTVMNDLYED